jgi:phospholipid/cholesterol/gamma-HCH transport system substrate-binding protein
MKRRDELLVGLLLLVAVALVLGGTLWIARGGLKRGYPMYARFPWGAGLKPGQQVLLAGVSVGTVDRVELIPDGTIAVKFSIQDQYKVPEGTTASVEPNGIFGDQLIALTPVKASTTYMPEGDTIPTGKGAAGLDEILQKGDSVALNVQALTDRFRRVYVEGGGIDDTRKVVADLSKLVAQLSTIATEQSKQLTMTQSQLRRTIASVDSAKIDSAIASVQAATAKLDSLARDVRQTNTQVQAVIDKVSNGNGSAAKFLNDPAIYNRVDSLLVRIDSLVADFKRNPRKFINLKIF